MHLFLARHGLATWPSWAGSDSERPLTGEGWRRMEAAAAGLARRLAREAIQLEVIFHSPLVRAAQTAEILAEHLALTNGLRANRLLQPGFNARGLQALLTERAAAQAVLCVGHAPDMGEVVLALTDRPVIFREGSVARLHLRAPERGVLAWLATADELAAEA